MIKLEFFQKGSGVMMHNVATGNSQRLFNDNIVTFKVGECVVTICVDNIDSLAAKVHRQ